MRPRTPRPKGPAGQFAERVEGLRKARGWTAESLAAKAGLGLGTVIRVEAARGSPTLDTILALANAVEVPVAELLGDPDPTPTPVITRGRRNDRQASRSVESILAQREQRAQPGWYRCRDCKETSPPNSILPSGSRRTRGMRCSKCGGILDREEAKP